jgi:hypothetical protein
MSHVSLLMIVLGLPENMMESLGSFHELASPVAGRPYGVPAHPKQIPDFQGISPEAKVFSSRMVHKNV